MSDNESRTGTESLRERPKSSIKTAYVELAQKWAVFFEIFLSPGVLLIVIATVGLMFLSETALQVGDLPRTASVVLTVVVSIFSSVVGALAWKRWNEATESGILVTRGKSAIRGLKLLLLNLASAEERVLRLRRGFEGASGQDERFLIICDEITDRFNSLQEETMNAIEEWADIIPEANIKTQIGVLSNLKKKAANLEAQVSRLSQDVKESDQEREELEGLIKRKETELERVREALDQRESAIDSSVLSGLTSGPLLELLGLFPAMTPDVAIVESFDICLHCRAKFPEGHLKELEFCPNCQKNVKGHFMSMSVGAGSFRETERVMKRVSPPGRADGDLDREGLGNTPEDGDS